MTRRWKEMAVVQNFVVDTEHNIVDRDREIKNEDGDESGDSSSNNASDNDDDGDH